MLIAGWNRYWILLWDVLPVVRPGSPALWGIEWPIDPNQVWPLWLEWFVWAVAEVLRRVWRWSRTVSPERRHIRHRTGFPRWVRKIGGVRNDQSLVRKVIGCRKREHPKRELPCWHPNPRLAWKLKPHSEWIRLIGLPCRRCSSLHVIALDRIDSRLVCGRRYARWFRVGSVRFRRWPYCENYCRALRRIRAAHCRWATYWAGLTDCHVRRSYETVAIGHSQNRMSHPGFPDENRKCSRKPV